MRRLSTETASYVPMYKAAKPPSMPSSINAVGKGRKTIAASQNMLSKTMRALWRRNRRNRS